MARGDALTDSTLKELVRVGNFKQALRNIEKKLKKQPKDSNLLILKADLLNRSDDLELSKEVVQKLTIQDPPLAQEDDVGRVFSIAHSLSKRGVAIPPAQLEALWQNALKARATSKDKISLAERWAEDSIGCDNWAHVAKAAGVLSKLQASNKNDLHKYYFWQITAHWLTEPSPDVTDERIRGLGKQMALRMLEKALEQTSRGGAAGNGVALTDQAQFNLLRLIYEQLGRHDQLVQAIEERSLGSQTSLAVDEWGVYQAKLNAYDVRDEHAACFSLAADVIRDALHRKVKWRLDDWKCFSYLHRHSVTEESKQKAQEIMEEILLSEPKSLQARIFMLKLQALHFKPSTSSDQISLTDALENLVENAVKHLGTFSGLGLTTSDVVENVLDALPQQYRRQYRFKLLEAIQISYEDMGKAVKEASDEELLQNVPTCVLYTQIGFQFSDYSNYGFNADADDQFNTIWNDDRNFLTSISSVLLTLCYDILKRGLQKEAGKSMDNLRTLAVRALLKARGKLRADDKNKDVYVIQSALVLRSLLEESEHAAEGRVMLINLLVYLGMPQLAQAVASKFDIKQILHDHSQPLISARVSSMFPFTSRDNWDPRQRLQTVANYYEDALPRISKQCFTALDSQQYAMVPNLVHMKNKTKCSNTCMMLMLEEKQLALLRNEPLGSLSSKISETWGLYNREPEGDEASKAWLEEYGSALLLKDPPPACLTYTNFLMLVAGIYDLSSDAAELPSLEEVRLKLGEHLYQRDPATGAAALTEGERAALDFAVPILAIRKAGKAELGARDPSSYIQLWCKILQKQVREVTLPVSGGVPTYNTLQRIVYTHTMLKIAARLAESLTKDRCIAANTPASAAMGEIPALAREKWGGLFGEVEVPTVEDLWGRCFGGWYEESGKAVLGVCGGEEGVREGLREMRAAHAEAVELLRRGLKW